MLDCLIADQLVVVPLEVGLEVDRLVVVLLEVD